MWEYLYFLNINWFRNIMANNDFEFINIHLIPYFI